MKFILRIEGQIAFITLDRPEVHNAINKKMWRKLTATLESLRKENLKVIVIAGSGTDFASGADLNEMMELKDHSQASDFWFAIEDCFDSLFNFPLPTIAMINGACLGGGCLLATACDFRFASYSSLFSVPVSKFGIMLDDSSIARLINLVGYSFTRMMLFTARTISSAEALKVGLVDGLYDEHTLKDQVLLVASSIAEK